MIEIKKSKTADTRSCDYKNVTKEQLLLSSKQHIDDIKKGAKFFSNMIESSAIVHDHDKIWNIDQFHEDFITGFEQHKWWDNHRRVNRHHLLVPDGVPDDVNLIDVLDMVIDCVMAGMARTGQVYPLKIDPDVLMKAFNNTVELLKDNVVVVEDKKDTGEIL